ncbi:MAG TPA: ABC transporter substrate-binding protein, partial [Solirubrobacterales bacterium]
MKPIGPLLICAAALALPGCGTEEPPEAPITISQTAGPDHLDPALAARISGREPLWLVYTPLLTYRHAEGERGAELIPGLASDLPEISADGRTYTLALREDIQYSDGTPVRASDFEHAIARVLYLGSAGAHFYEGIAGAREYERGGDPERQIEGIEADDETGEITITLTAPDPGFADALALTFAGLVPAKTPFRDLSAEPPPGVGPYEITEADTDGGFVLSRSPNFGELDIPDIPTGNIAEITNRVVPDRLRQAQEVLDGKLDYMQDPPPEELISTIVDQASDRFITHPTPATAYFFLDAGLAPFADPLVREAVNRGLDRAAVAELYGGRMEAGCALLAPGVPGYDRALDTTDCPYGNPTEPPD